MDDHKSEESRYDLHSSIPTYDRIKQFEYDFTCSDNLKYMKKMKSDSMQLIVTSPPYNIGKSYEKRVPLEKYVNGQKEVIDECIRILKPGGSICWQVGNHVVDSEIFPLDIFLYPIFTSHGLKLRNRIVWHFEHGLHCSKRLSGRYETILWFTKDNSNDEFTFNLDPIRIPSKYPNKKYFKGPKKGQLSCNPLGKNPGDVWIIPNVKSNHPEKTEHPCQFPVELIERLVLSLTNKNDSVFDPYAGVGSSLIAALIHNRKAYGCELDSKYVKIGIKRIKDLMSGNLLTRPMGKPVYDPSLPRGGH